MAGDRDDWLQTLDGRGFDARQLAQFERILPSCQSSTRAYTTVTLAISARAQSPRKNSHLRR